MRLRRMAVCMAGVLACATALVAQAPKGDATGCEVSQANRSITFCAPVEGSTITANFRPYIYINNSLPHTNKMYVDDSSGEFSEEAPVEGSIFQVDAFSHRGLTTPGWHKITVVVWDSEGWFKNTVRFRVSGEPQCGWPATDRSIAFCSPVNGAKVQSPVHISAVARSSSPAVKRTIAYVDGNQVEEASNINPANGQRGDTISTFVPLAPGPHTIMIKAVDLDEHTFTRTVNIEVVEAD